MASSHDCRSPCRWPVRQRIRAAWCSTKSTPGVGGAVAEIVGRELKALGFSGQTLCVTHLPQVAAQGHHQLRVSKLTDGKTTRTTLSELTMDERVEEVARMLGGKEITGKARDHAREMLQMAGNPDQKATQREAQGLTRPAPTRTAVSCACPASL